MSSDTEPTEKADPRLIDFYNPALRINAYGGYWGFRHPVHDWKMVKNTGKHRYDVCTVCKRRRIVVVHKDGAQPVDQGWLATGEWTEMGEPPRQGSSVDMRRSEFDSTAPRDQPMPNEIWACRWNSEFCTGPKDCGDSDITRKQRFCTAYVRGKK